MSKETILLLVLLVGAPLLMALMHRGGAHQGHGHGGSGGGCCGGGGHAGHNHGEPPEQDRATLVLGKPGPRRHGEASPEGEGEPAVGTGKGAAEPAAPTPDTSS